ncbi:MAG: hypothetical protein M5R36_22355 [Deltaproteobacteria bacterium]|nr:hypothetical protein [Deltaproteobacteria bacterium]
MPDDSQTNLAALAEKLGVTFGDPAILQEALTHSSFVHERGLAPGADYERLEFFRRRGA